MLKDLSCKPGSYVEIVPVGLFCTLQYNTNGILQKIIKGFDYTDYQDSDEFDSSFTIELKRLNIVPQRINFSTGTTWVRGVFYSKKLFNNNGKLPDCVQKDIFEDLKSHLSEYTFYAGDIKNDRFKLTGGVIIANRMSTLGFNVLPGYQVYDDCNPLPIQEIMKLKKSPFLYPYISGVFICEGPSVFRYLPADLYQYEVSSTENYIDSFGYIHTLIELPDQTLDKSYSEVVHYDIQAKSTVVLDDTNILYSRHQNSLFRSKLSRNTHCTVCGKAMVVPVVGYATCTDIHCVSRLYPNIQRFTSILDLPLMSFDEFKNYVKSKEITCLADILLLDKYADCKVECTLSTLLAALVPITYVRTIDFFQQFTNYLGSIEAFDYYIQNPLAIINDLHLDKLASTGFSNWLRDPYNLLELQTMMNCEQITILPVNKRFEGSPIFRNKTICVTGKFKHGTLEDIISILKSYSAKVVTRFDNTVSCVILGEFENEDKEITNLATSYHIPIYSEDDFFRFYDIDLDILKQKNNCNVLSNESVLDNHIA